MRRRFLPYLIIACAIFAFIWANSTIRAFCTEITFPFRRVLVWAESHISMRLSAAWRGFCDGPTRETHLVEIDRLRIMLQTSDAIAQENVALREALQWQQSQPLQVVAAPIWSYGGGLGVWPRLQLSAGSLQGVQTGDIVLVPEGLVGRISENVTLHTSEVILLSDPACRVAAEVPGGAKGVIQGMQGVDFGESAEEPLLYTTHPLSMRFIARNANLTPGQSVYTEGSGGLFLRGLKIGTITERRENPAELLSEVLVEPAVNPTTLKTVFVLTRTKTP
ncbi:MAG: rod shape-determining protein MreC [Kiritimatiellae bacterium]|nr:rod shape-determining protein MreC [Kiritimatiellia bacterium]